MRKPLSRSGNLSALLEENRDQLDDSMMEDIKSILKFFKREYGFGEKFRKPTKIALVKRAISENRSVRAIYEKKFSDFEHGYDHPCLTPVKNFSIDKKTVERSRRTVSMGGRKLPSGFLK